MSHFRHMIVWMVAFTVATCCGGEWIAEAWRVIADESHEEIPAIRADIEAFPRDLRDSEVAIREGLDRAGDGWHRAMGDARQLIRSSIQRSQTLTRNL